MVVEATRLPGGGSLRVTGTVGPKLTESAQVALTWVRANAGRFASLHASFDDAFDLLHVHLPRAGRSKDGASAGVTLADAVVSALTGEPVRGDVAMTGELTLGGQLEPVAGIREKVLAACRSGIATVVLPAANEADVGESFPGGLPSGISVRYASILDQVLTVALPDLVRSPRQPARFPASPVLQPPDQVHRPRRALRARRRALPRERPSTVEEHCWEVHERSRPDTEGPHHPPPRRNSLPRPSRGVVLYDPTRIAKDASRRRDLTGAAERNRACDDDGDGVQDLGGTAAAALRIGAVPGTRGRP